VWQRGGAAHFDALERGAVDGAVVREGGAQVSQLGLYAGSRGGVQRVVRVQVAVRHVVRVHVLRRRRHLRRGVSTVKLRIVR
jgi:hypothetical protein